MNKYENASFKSKTSRRWVVNLKDRLLLNYVLYKPRNRDLDVLEVSVNYMNFEQLCFNFEKLFFINFDYSSINEKHPPLTFTCSSEYLPWNIKYPIQAYSSLDHVIGNRNICELDEFLLSLNLTKFIQMINSPLDKLFFPWRRLNFVHVYIYYKLLERSLKGTKWESEFQDFPAEIRAEVVKWLKPMGNPSLADLDKALNSYPIPSKFCK